MSKHTPGPWYVGTEFYDQGRHIYATQTVRDDEGEEWHPLIATTDDDERLIDWQANARLIAAAPELLEALIEYKRMYEEAQSAGGWQGVYETGNAAIAKATSTTKE